MISRRRVIAGAAGVFIAAAIAVRFLGLEFLPKLEEGNLWIRATMPSTISLEEGNAYVNRMREEIGKFKEIETVVSQHGRPDDGTDPKGPYNLEIKADLKPHDTWRFATKDAMIEDMSKKIRVMPGIQTNFSQVIEDNLNEAISGARGEIVVKVFGPDLQILEDKSEQIADVLNSIRGAADVGVFKIGGQSELTVTLDRTR